MTCPFTADSPSLPDGAGRRDCVNCSVQRLCQLAMTLGGRVGRRLGGSTWTLCVCLAATPRLQGRGHERGGAFLERGFQVRGNVVDRRQGPDIDTTARCPTAAWQKPRAAWAGRRWRPTAGPR